MKLKDMNGEQSLKCIEEILPSIANIGGDKNVLSVLVEMQPNDETKLEWYSRILSLIPKVMEGHEHDFIQIMASVNLMSYEEYNKSANLITMTKELYNLFQDEDVMFFFKGALKSA